MTQITLSVKELSVRIRELSSALELTELQVQLEIENKEEILQELGTLHNQHTELQQGHKRRIDELERELSQVKEQNESLEAQVELKGKAKPTAENKSAMLIKGLSQKEARMESIKEELRSNQARAEVLKAERENLLHEIQSLRETNFIREERDTLFHPCTHMQSCLSCAKELIRNDKPCPICDEPLKRSIRYTYSL